MPFIRKKISKQKLISLKRKNVIEVKENAFRKVKSKKRKGIKKTVERAGKQKDVRYQD